MIQRSTRYRPSAAIPILTLAILTLGYSSVEDRLNPATSPPASTPISSAGSARGVLTGIDILERDGFKQLAGARVGLVTNQTGRDRTGKSTIDVLAEARNLTVVALFSPEHGIRGVEDKTIGDSRDEKTGLPIYSLYLKDRRRPTAEMLKGIDTLVYDIQDVGVRFYTYIATCGYLLEEAARNHIRMVVLDRPDPINGSDIEGPVAQAEFVADPELNFVCYHPLPVRYGLTIGELAMLLNSERKIGARLAVIKAEGWRRTDYGTGLAWVNPSPNMRSLTEAVLYPGVGLLEMTNVSVGRGTDIPFEVVGAPWIDGPALAWALGHAGLSGVRFEPTRFTPKSSTYANQECSGVNLIVTDRDRFHPVATAIEIAYQLHRLYPDQWIMGRYIRLLNHRPAYSALESGKNASEIAATWQTGLADFDRTRRRYLLY